MYHLDIITKMPEPEDDGIIRIRPGESALVRIDGGNSASSAPDIRGRPAEWRDKKNPALIIAISDDPKDIFTTFQVLEYMRDPVSFIAISSDIEALLSCSAGGKILCKKITDCVSGSSEPMHYLQEIIVKTEYCIILCSRMNPAGIELAGEIAQFAREQNTLTVLVVTKAVEPDCYENLSDILGKFHTIILNPDDSTSGSIEQIRDLCEATLDEIVASGGRRSLESEDPRKVRELLFNGGISFLGSHRAGEPDANGLISRYVKSVQENKGILNRGTYSILKIPWESTIDDAIALRNSLIDILVEKVPSRYPHLMRIEGYYPETNGQYDLSIWIFTGNWEVHSIYRQER